MAKKEFFATYFSVKIAFKNAKKQPVEEKRMEVIIGHSDFEVGEEKDVKLQGLEQGKRKIL